MKTNDEDLSKVIDLLRKSKPLLESSDDIEREVIRRITAIDRSRTRLSDILDFLFGWVYIGWVRRSLIAASIFLVLIFGWQQSIIIRRIDRIDRQIVITRKDETYSPGNRIEKLLMIYRSSGHSFHSGSVTISEQQMNEIIESVNELQGKYKDLEKLIESDPELKKMIERKLIENRQSKFNL